MTTQINQNNIQASTLAELGSGPTVTNIQITNSSYVVLDDTAVSTSGGYIKITGTNFASGCEVIIGSTNATAVAFVSSTVLNVQVPALSAGTYVVYVVNIDGSVAIRVNGLTSSGTPTWVTGSTLAGGTVNVAISIQLSATGDAPLTYSLASGSSLPSGLTLTSGGLLSGTVTGITVETIYNFTIDVTDAQSQESPRSFSITISVSDQYFMYNTALLSATALTLPFNNDASTNNFAVTVVGDTRPNNFGPYTPGYYSNFFDGTGDYLTVPNNINLTIGSGDFTIECWVYYTGPAGGATYGYQIAGPNTGQGSSGWGVVINRNIDTRGFGFVNANGWVTSGATFIVPNVWTHLAVTRSGLGTNNVKCFINGVVSSQVSYNTADSYTATPVYIGADGLAGSQYPGYISNFRFVSGTAVYTSAFTPPTTPLTAIANTSLLTCQSNRFIDNSTNAFTVTRNGDTLVSGFDPFVPASDTATIGSGYFDGTGDWLVTTTSPATLSGSFTIEAWVYITSLAAGRSLVCVGDDNTSTGALFFVNTSGRLAVYGNGGNILVGTSQTVAVNTWNHVAFVRSSGTITAYLNGVADSTTASNSTSFTGANRIGGELFAGNAGGTIMLGYISNYRLVNGTAVYTSAFTPPTSPLTAVSGTSLLTLQTNQPNNNNAFLDSSTNNFLVTRNGNTTQGSFSPYGPLWSNYFDGNGDYLSLASSSAFNMGVSNFTVEAWYYFTELPGAGTNDNLYTFGSFNPYLYLWGDGTIVLRSAQSSGDIINVAHGFTVGQWYHLALVKTGTSFVLYRNGSVLGSGTSAAIVSQNKSLEIGGQSTFGFTGYMSNFRTVNGTSVYTSTFTPSTSPLTAIANTSLLTCTDNRLIDDSPNNFTITRNGDVSVQRFSPFSPQTVTTFYSGYFDGTGDYLTTSSNSAQFGTNSFTIEFWIYLSSLPAAVAIIDFRAASGATFGQIYINTDRTVHFYLPADAATSNTITLNAWNHVAITRGSGTLRMFINGVSGFSGSDSATYNAGAVLIGGGVGGTSLMTGYLSNVRFVIGTAVYTSAFTPPTAPLTAISGTSLLTCQSATFIDNSTNNFTITVFGNSIPTTVSPFTPTATTGVAYSPSTYGGSMYLDGTGDWLTTPSNAAFNFTANFTVEAWIYPNNLTGARQIASTRASSSTATSTAWSLCLNGSALAWFTTAFNISGGTININAWNHVAAARVGSTVTLYLNGISIGTATLSNNFTDQQLAIGACINGTEPFIGYISNVRVIRSSAAYTSNFAPPVSPLTAIQNNVLLLNGTSAGIYDMSMMNNYETVGNSSLVTNIEKYGNSSLYFDGSVDYLYVPNNVNYQFGTGNYTVEFWLNMTSFSGQNTVIVDFRTSNGATGGAIQLYVTSAGIVTVYGGSSTSTLLVTAGSAISTATWAHIALTRSSNSTRLFINGTQSGSTATDSTSYGLGALWLGSSASGSNYLTGYIDDLRITKGVARYTTTFTPPSSPFIAS